MKRLVFVMLLATSFVLSYQPLLVPEVAAGGATIAALDSAWNSQTPLATPLGKVIYNIPNNRKKMNLTYILQGAVPNESYNVGFNMSGSCLVGEPDSPPTTFGGLARILCGTWQRCGLTNTAGIYQVGTLRTDELGDGDLHINLRDLPSGDHRVVFWVSQGTGTLNPVASTVCFGDKFNYETIAIPPLS